MSLSGGGAYCGQIRGGGGQLDGRAAAGRRRRGRRPPRRGGGRGAARASGHGLPPRRPPEAVHLPAPLPHHFPALADAPGHAEAER